MAKEEATHKKIAKIREEVREVEEINKLANEYALKYPSFKFVDRKTMLEIMVKYNLVLGDTFLYNKEIPSKSLDIIHSFAKEIEESMETWKINKVETSSSYTRGFRYRMEHVPKQEKIKQMSDEELETQRRHWDLQQRMMSSFHEYVTEVDTLVKSKLKMIAPMSHFDIPVFPIQDNKGKDNKVPLVKLNLKSRQFEFDLIELNEVAKEHDREVLDPIACLEVKGGYIILDAWDKEAEIPEIKNPMIN